MNTLPDNYLPGDNVVKWTKPTPGSYFGLDLASKEEPKHDNNEPLRCRLRPVANNLKLTCGHKLDTTSLPKRSCADCWKVFFIKNEEMTKNNMQVLVNGGGDAICKQLGNKYLKQLQRFAIFVHETVKAVEEKQDGNTVTA
jgi:hypothetical protein